MYVFMYVCMYVCIHVCIYTYTSTYIHMLTPPVDRPCPCDSVLLAGDLAEMLYLNTHHTTIICTVDIQRCTFNMPCTEDACTRRAAHEIIVLW